MKKKRKYNPLCERCAERCKQPSYVTIVYCPFYRPIDVKNETESKSKVSKRD